MSDFGTGGNEEAILPRPEHEVGCALTQAHGTYDGDSFKCRFCVGRDELEAENERKHDLLMAADEKILALEAKLAQAGKREQVYMEALKDIWDVVDEPAVYATKLAAAVLNVLDRVPYRAGLRHHTGGTCSAS